MILRGGGLQNPPLYLLLELCSVLLCNPKLITNTHFAENRITRRPLDDVWFVPGYIRQIPINQSNYICIYIYICVYYVCMYLFIYQINK